MAGFSRTIRIVVTTALLLLMGLLVLQALAYGLGFAIDPERNVGEFGSPPPDPADHLTVELVGLVGVGMIGAAVGLVLSAVFVLLRNPAGAAIAMLIGGLYVLSGLCAWRAGWGWDAYFYSITGVLLILLSAAVGLLQSSRFDPETERGHDPPDGD